MKDKIDFIMTNLQEAIEDSCNLTQNLNEYILKVSYQIGFLCGIESSECSESYKERQKEKILEDIKKTSQEDKLINYLDYINDIISYYEEESVPKNIPMNKKEILELHKRIEHYLNCLNLVEE